MIDFWRGYLITGCGFALGAMLSQDLRGWKILDAVLASTFLAVMWAPLIVFGVVQGWTRGR